VVVARPFGPLAGDEQLQIFSHAGKGSRQVRWLNDGSVGMAVGSAAIAKE
jgi:hypothetical protein